MSAYSLPLGTKLAEGHEVVQVLGQGGFGITYRVKATSGADLAMKEFFPERDADRVNGTLVRPKPGRKRYFDLGYTAFLEEARLLNRLPESRGLVRIMRAFEKHDTAYALMEFIDGDPLNKAAQEVIDKRGAIPVVLIRELVEALLNALNTVHRIGVIHRDIKPANVMIRRDRQPVLIDFGASRRISGSTAGASIFSRNYAALEQFPKKATGFSGAGRQTPSVDIFGMSVMLYELVSQSLPQDAEERFKTLSATGEDPYVPVRENILRNRISTHYPDVLLDAIDAGCALLPENRIQTAREMAYMQDAFVRPSRKPQPSEQPASPSPHRPIPDKPVVQGTWITSSGVWIIVFLILALVLGGVTFGLKGF